MFEIRKLMDEGSSEPFIARLWIGLLELSESVFGLYPDKPARKQKYQELYRPVLENVGLARSAALKIVHTIQEHRRQIEAGSVISRQHAGYSVDQTIDLEVREQFSLFLNSGVRALKSLQVLTRWFEVEIGHLYQKESKFVIGQKALSDTGHPMLSEYLNQSRSGWLEAFVELRNDYEHAGGRLGDFGYDIDGLSCTLNEPCVCGEGVSAYSSGVIESLWVFVEEILVYCLYFRLPDGLIVSEIAESERPEAIPRRFKMTLASQVETQWMICPSEARGTE
jgi:hypothetical protein